MQGYLLDTNAVFHWYREVPALVQRINALDQETPVRISVVTLGELEFGHNLHLNSRDLVERDEFADWIDRQFPAGRLLNVTRHTRHCYGAIRAAIFEKYPPLGHDENHPERCYDRVAGSEVGIDENDLWIAAQAIEQGLILITADNMERIKEAGEAYDFPLKYENWSL